MLRSESDRLALIPGGGSFMRIRDCRRMLTGMLGFASIVRNKRKFLCGLRVCSFFSNCPNQEGARWTFLSNTQVP